MARTCYYKLKFIASINIFTLSVHINLYPYIDLFAKLEINNRKINFGMKRRNLRGNNKLILKVVGVTIRLHCALK